MPKLLVSEKIPWMVMLFGYASIPAILAVFFFGYQIFDAIPDILRGEPQIGTICVETIPPDCSTYNSYPPLLPNITNLIIAIAISGLFWSTGFRYRAAWHEDDGSLKITWGEKILPLAIKRYGAKSLSNFTITFEKRFTVSPIVGTGATRVGQAPDRWRVKAMHAGRLINVGSFASEREAKSIVTLLS